MFNESRRTYVYSFFMLIVAAGMCAILTHVGMKVHPSIFLLGYAMPELFKAFNAKS